MLIDHVQDEISLTVTIQGHMCNHTLRFEKCPGGWNVTATFPPEDRMRARMGWSMRVQRTFLDCPAEDRQALLGRFQAWGSSYVQDAFRGYSASFREFLSTGMPEEVERRMDEENEDEEPVD